MRHLRFELVGGASGDMILGTLAKLAGGAAAEKTFAALKSVLHHEKFDVKVGDVVRGGLSGVRAEVTELAHSHHHRTLGDIEKILSSPELSDGARERALKVFRRLAEAEASVHGVTPDKIHFHEVGAVDSIIDIAGSCMLLDALGVDEISFSPLPCGHGSITCAHGTMPNPAPATAELSKGFPVELVDEPSELVTPTGAALLTALGRPSAPLGGVLVDSAASFGRRELKSRPNMLRASLLESSDGQGFNRDVVSVLETNIDDCQPEIIGGLCEKLMSAGALDVFTIPAQMKKQRPGVLLTVICAEEKKAALAKIIFEESTTFGVRESSVGRMTLERETWKVATEFGEVTVKAGLMGGRRVTLAPEYEDCARASRETGRPLREVYSAALREAEKKMDPANQSRRR